MKYEAVKNDSKTFLQELFTIVMEQSPLVYLILQNKKGLFF